MIPKTLHQVWIGPEPPPLKWMSTWKSLHPKWEYRLWREADLEALPWHDPAYNTYQRYIKDKRYCGAVNVARAQILHDFGGVYIDADMVCLHTIDGAPFMQHQAWVSQSPHNPSRTQNAAMGSEPGLKLMATYVEAQGRATEIHPSWQKTGSVLFDAVCTVHPDVHVEVVPSPAFHPKDKTGRPNPARRSYKGRIYADHHFLTTRSKKTIRSGQPSE